MARKEVSAESGVDAIWVLLQAGRISDAVAACQALNRARPDSAEGWHVSSHAAECAGLPDKALQFIDRARTLEPANPGYLMQHALLLQRVGRAEEGLELAQRLVDCKPTTAAANNVLGSTLAHYDLHKEALAAFDRAVALHSGRADYHFNRAAQLRFLGQMSAAESACNRCLALDPGHNEAYLLRSDLRRQSARDNHVEELRTRLSSVSDDWRGESQLCFALAKELEDLESYAESFRYRLRGANLRRRHMRYDADRDLQTMALVEKVFDARTLREAAPGCPDASPIFIIGLPRTGTTLLERILGSHSEVRAVGELNQFARGLVDGVHAAVGAPPDREIFITSAAQIDFRELGEHYIRATTALRRGSPRFVDKLPLNFLYAGLIHMALPQARILHLGRHPMATCYAVFKQPFRNAYPFSYSLTELANYYVAYDRLMAHWRRVIPSHAMLELRYEDLVDQTETQTRRVLAFLGLGWEPRCLEFHRSESASTTASASQVRQPVYRRSLEQWRHYSGELAPVRAILSTAGIAGLD